MLGVLEQREFAQFCDYRKDGIGKEKGKALVRPAAHKQKVSHVCRTGGNNPNAIFTYFTCATG